MKLRSKKKEAVIEEILRASLPELERLGVERWACSLTNGEAHPLAVWVADAEWLVMDAPVRELTTPGEMWDYYSSIAALPAWANTLCRQTIVGAGARRDPAGRRNQCRAPAPGNMRRFRDRPGFLQRTPARSFSRIRSRRRVHASHCDLAALCAEAGWASSQRSGVVRVELNGQRGFLQATLETVASGSVRAYVDLVSCGSWSTESRWAMASLLLAASRVVRLARGFAEERNRVLSAGFEVRFGDAPSAFELARCSGGAIHSLWALDRGGSSPGGRIGRQSLSGPSNGCS